MNNLIETINHLNTWAVSVTLAWKREEECTVCGKSGTETLDVEFGLQEFSFPLCKNCYVTRFNTLEPNQQTKFLRKVMEQ